MKLLLHSPDSDNKLSQYYQRAFKQAVELFIVTAYLTEWDISVELNLNCRGFRMIIGKDFGITRKAACKAVMRWLPSKRKGQFVVADMINGFHPKADVVKFKAPRGASEGARYVDLAKKLRFSLLQNPKHPAKNLAEIDAVIWLAFGKN